MIKNRIWKNFEGGGGGGGAVRPPLNPPLLVSIVLYTYI